jgi:hypothetical protein
MKLKKVKRFFGQLAEKLSWRWRAEGRAEEPDALLPRVVYLIGEQEVWAAVFLCPCGCRKPVWLNLLKGHRPRWSVSVTAKGVPTVSPSINRRVGCRSHFFLRAGKIVWCRRRRRFWF